LQYIAIKRNYIAIYRDKNWEEISIENLFIAPICQLDQEFMNTKPDDQNSKRWNENCVIKSANKKFFSKFYYITLWKTQVTAGPLLTMGQ